MARITLDDLAHTYESNPQHDADFALRHVDHVWQDGGAYSLLGPSGCGKSTLLNIISGLLVPSRGQILFDDNDVTLLTPEQRNIAQVFQFPVIYDTMTVKENLAFPLVNRGVARDEIDRRVSDMLDTLELRDQADRRAQNLTADQKQKISLGRGLVRYDVNAILFDEPLTVIDPQMKFQLRTRLKELHEQYGHTMIYVTHDQTEALTFADKVVVMYEGEVVQIGSPEELFDTPAHTFVGYFIGSPGMNVLPLESGRDAITVADVALRPAGYDGAHIAAQDEGRLELGIRPEFVEIVSRTDGRDGQLPYEVRAVENVGREIIVRGSVAGHPVDAIMPEGATVPSEPAAVFDTGRMLLYRDSHLLPRETA